MLTIATIVFALTALLGLYLASYVFRNKNTPKGVVIIHGAVGAFGLLLLITYAFTSPSAPIASLVLFILAALGGITIFLMDITHKNHLKTLVPIHGLVAIAAFILLVLWLFT